MELLRAFSAAFLCALAVYIVLKLQWRPRLDTDLKEQSPVAEGKTCEWCDEPNPSIYRYCEACRFAWAPDGVTYWQVQEEVDSVTSEEGRV